MKDFLNALLPFSPFTGIKKTKLSSSIVTAGDKEYFVPIQALISSINLSHEFINTPFIRARLVVCDLGFTQRQREWITRQGEHGFNILLFKPKIVIGKDVFFWQTWNKPFYIKQAAKICKTRIIWIDADCIVTGPLKILDKLVSERFTIISDTAAINHSGFEHGTKEARNSKELYNLYPTSSRFEAGEIPNAGVIGIDVNRELDAKILDNWIWLIGKCVKDKRLLDKKIKDRHTQGWIAWHDQGALQWAMEKCNATGNSIKDLRFNDPKTLSKINSYKNLIGRLHDIEDTKIAHFPSGDKPYKHFPNTFNPEAIQYPKNRTDLKIFVLGHKPDKKNGKLSGPCLEHIYLPGISKENDLAESRIFLTNKISLCNKEYIGLATAQWDIKYKDKCLPLNELHKLPMQLSRVWCGAKSDFYWYEYTEQIHPGMKKYLDYLIKELNIKYIKHEIPWSNNFIAHHSVLNNLQQWWWNCWSLLKIKFGSNIKYGMDGFDTTRTGSYLAERISMLFFCMRDDLKYIQIPQ